MCWFENLKKQDTTHSICKEISKNIGNKTKYETRKYFLLIVFVCLILTNASLNLIHTHEQIVVNENFEQW